MGRRTEHVRILALLLGMVFLGAQFHFCTDVPASASATHVCPVCSVAGAAVATESPTVAMIPATDRLEVVSLPLAAASVSPRAVSPRAPPAL